MPAPDVHLPWLDEIWSRLQASREADRLAHGLLITGPRGVGKRHLVERFARSLLCRERLENDNACGRCTDCHLVAAGSHPDLIRVGPDPEAKSDEIPIGAIRAFAERESLTPSRADWKVALIDPADRLNPAAANALLKTLEEPAGRTILCLIGERIGQLPATIRSRCQQIKAPIPSESDALAWLKEQTAKGDQSLRLRLAHGAPLRALSEFDDDLLEQRRQRLAGWLAVAAGTRDPVSEAATWNSLGAHQILDWLAGWLCDLLRLIVADTPARLDNPDRRTDFANLARRLDPAAGHRFLQRVLAGRAYTADTNVNQLLLLESLAIEWSRLNQGRS
jgi:DNA polymerase-3 subunit delta'